MNNIEEDLITTEAVPALSKNGVTVQVLRLDKVHAVISGNKWFKLRFHLEAALQQNREVVLTFGGAYSNHIIATAAACAQYGLKCVGLIRGEEPATPSHTLQTAARLGMHLIFMSREAYKTKAVPPSWQNKDYYLIPEGGYGPRGAAGAATIPYKREDFDVVACAVGTGTMMAGLINSKGAPSSIIGFSALKNHSGLEKEVVHLLRDKEQTVTINHDYHFGGYAKYSDGLIGFMNALYQQTGIPTDFVYTAKMFWGMRDLIDKGVFQKGSRILLVHSGGLQGNFSLRKGTLIF